MLRFVQCGAVNHGSTGRAGANGDSLTVSSHLSCFRNHRRVVRAGRGAGCWSRRAASPQRRSRRSCGSGIPRPSWAPAGRAPRPHRLTVHGPPAVLLALETSGHENLSDDSIHHAQNRVCCTPAQNQQRCSYQVGGEDLLSLLSSSLHHVLCIYGCIFLAGAAQAPSARALQLHWQRRCCHAVNEHLRPMWHLRPMLPGSHGEVTAQGGRQRRTHRSWRPPLPWPRSDWCRRDAAPPQRRSCAARSRQ